jgi:predicted RNA-binding protein with PIN domain
MHWLIDGYNLLHKSGGAGRSLEEARERLLIRLAGLTGKGHRVTVVFDNQGRPAGPGGTGARIPGLKTVFAPVADDYIIKMVRESDTPRDITVVSSDREVTGVSRQLGAQVVDAVDFARRLTPPKDGRGKEPAEKYR